MPNVRSDLVDVYIVRRAEQHLEFLQLRRAPRPADSLAGTWQPIMGHVESGESAIDTALRELAEEVGLNSGSGDFVAMWALQGVHPYFLASRDAIMLSPRFVAEVSQTWIPKLNAEHDAWRWVPAREVGSSFLWPGQQQACAECIELLARPSHAADSASQMAANRRSLLRVYPPTD